MGEPDERDQLDARSFARLRRTSSVLMRQWSEYVRLCLASIEKRANMLDEQGLPRVTRSYHSFGSLRHVDLADWRGRHRVRVLYNSAGEPVEIRLLALSGKEVSYTQESFDLKGANFDSLGSRLERARQSAVLLFKDASSKQEQLARRSI